ncbi:MAG: KdsC family phosphatase [Gammaproteobacteria bacterium]
MSELPSNELQAVAANIKLCVFDVDGVLTNGQIVLGPDNSEYKAFDVKDGQGLVMLREYIDIGVITGRRSEVVQNRMAQLGIKYVYQGQKNKTAALADLLSKLQLSADLVCYVGDDLPDLGIMSSVGLPVAVSDAVPAVKEVAKWCTSAAGGQGAAREVCEMLLRAQGRLDKPLEKLGDSATNGTLS